MPFDRNLSSSQQKIVDGYKEFLLNHELPQSITQGPRYAEYRAKNAEELLKHLQEARQEPREAVRGAQSPFSVVGTHRKISKSINFESMKELREIEEEFRKDLSRSQLPAREILNRSSRTSS